MIKKIAEKDLLTFAKISGNAYPSFQVHTKEEEEKLQERYSFVQEKVPNEHIYGLYRDELLLGGMLLHDFQMNYMNTMIPCGGLGSLAVDLLHKKEKVAKELVEFYLNHYRSKGVNLAILYPFRLDFYKNMGFGYGTKMNQYELKPSAFKKSVLKKNVYYLTEEDKDEVKRCYNDYVHKTHGMIEMEMYDHQRMFKNPKLKAIGYKVNNKLEGFLFYTFKSEKDNFLINDIVIHKFICNTKDAFLGLQGFLNSQLDQIRHVIINTQDESFYHLFTDPTNNSNHIIPHVYHESNVQGVGIMYRIINVEGFFKDIKNYRFNKANCSIKFSITDNFIEDNNKELVIEFQDGLVKIANQTDYDVEIKMNIAEFSSMMMGAIDFKTLYKYSLTEISNIDYLDLIHRMFQLDEKPICMTGF